MVRAGKPSRAAVLLHVYGEGSSKARKAVRFILNHSQATAANVYLLLYPKPVLALQTDPALGRKAWEFLDSISPDVLLGEGRVYGGGLYKMEPKELANVPAEAIAAMLPGGEDRPASQDGDVQKICSVANG